MRTLMQRRAFADWTGIAVGVVVVGLAGTLAIADGEPDGSDCCFTQTCPNGQSAEHCTDDNCPSGTVCSGDGGCTPVVWAKAECIDEPVGP